MDDDVFEAFVWFLRKIGVQSNAASAKVAAAPFRFHLLHKDALHVHADYRLPLCDQIRHGSFDLFSIPPGDDGLLRIAVCSRASPQDHLAVPQHDFRLCVFLNCPEQVTLSPDVMALAVQVLARAITSGESVT